MASQYTAQSFGFLPQPTAVTWMTMQQAFPPMLAQQGRIVTLPVQQGTAVQYVQLGAVAQQGTLVQQGAVAQQGTLVQQGAVVQQETAVQQGAAPLPNAMPDAEALSTAVKCIKMINMDNVVWALKPLGFGIAMESMVVGLASLVFTWEVLKFLWMIFLIALSIRMCLLCFLAKSFPHELYQLSTGTSKGTLPVANCWQQCWFLIAIATILWGSLWACLVYLPIVNIGVVSQCRPESEDHELHTWTDGRIAVLKSLQTQCERQMPWLLENVVDCIPLCVQPGIPLLVGFTFVRLFKNSFNFEVYLPFIRLIVLHFADLATFATLPFDVTALMWLRQNTWDVITLPYVVVAFTACSMMIGISCRLLGITVTWPAGQKYAQIQRVQQDSSDPHLVRYYVGSCFIDLPLLVVRTYLCFVCGVQVQKLFLSKNCLCIVYAVAELFHVHVLRMPLGWLMTTIGEAECVEDVMSEAKAKQRLWGYSVILDVSRGEYVDQEDHKAAWLAFDLNDNKRISITELKKVLDLLGFCPEKKEAFQLHLANHFGHTLTTTDMEVDILATAWEEWSRQN